MSSNYDIYEFRIGKRPSGRKVVEIHIKLPFHVDSVKGIARTFNLGFLTKENIDDINKLYGDL